MYIKNIALLLLVLMSSFSSANEVNITFEIIEAKMDVLSKKDIQKAEIKKDVANKPYVDLILTREGVEKVTKTTKELKGKTINIWIDKYPVSLSTPVHSAITSENIRVPMDTLKDAEELLELLKSNS